ncbi:MAG: LysM peptidoglycan-binding domain-containing protein [Anaerolineae bacterium]|nr:LysM peptidoglycan-binding domain-containing protein [Anaerolineae bacterium]
MHRKLIPFVLIMVLIPAFFLTSCKKAAPDVDISQLQPEDETIIMQEEALDNTGEADAGDQSTPESEVADSGQGSDGNVDESESWGGDETGEGGNGETEGAETAEVTPEPTPEPTQAPAPEPVSATPGVHVVQPGETLYSIAVRYGTTVGAVSQANSIANPSLIHPGQELRIPAGSSEGTMVTPPTTTGGTVYVVKHGDNLFRIGLRFGFDQYYLAQYNGIENVSMIYVGQEIRIP